MLYKRVIQHKGSNNNFNKNKFYCLFLCLQPTNWIIFVVTMRVKYFFCKTLLAIIFLLVALSPVDGLADNWGYYVPHKQVPDSLLQKIFDSSVLHSDAVKEYKGELYLKGLFTVHHQNRLMKYLPQMFKLEKGVNNYIYESISDLHYTAPTIYDRKLRALISTFPNPKSEAFDIMEYMKFNLYSSSLMGDRLLSPLSETSRIHYHYELDSIVYERTFPIYKIKIIPKYNSTQLLTGSVWISSWNWLVMSFDLKGKYDMMTFRVRMTMGKVPELECLPEKLMLDLYFNFLGNRVEMNYHGWMNYKYIKAFQSGEIVDTRSKSERCNISTSYTLTCDTSKLITDRAYFLDKRPVSLAGKEDSLYIKYKERKSQRAEKASQKNSLTLKQRNMVFWGQVGDALISSYDIDLPKIGSIRCSPLINPVLISYSHRRGLSYKQVFKFNKLFYNGHLLRIVPQIGYNFTKKEFYVKGDIKYVYNPRKQGEIELSAGNGNRIYSSVVLDQLRQLPDSTFTFDGLNLDYFKDIYLNLSHSKEIINGLRLWTGISMHWRYTASTPELDARVPSQYNSFAPRIRLEWTPYMHYYINGNRKINVGSKYPTFTVDYERGFKVFKHSGKHERIEMSAEQVLKFRKIYSLAYHVGCGFFSKQSGTYFVDYVNFNYRNLPEGWNDAIGGKFEMLDSRWYNSSSHYVSGNFIFESPFILLYPMGKMLSFIQKERLYGGLVFLPHLNPYFEFGYGFGTHLFDAGVFIGNENGKFTSVGFKFTFELFND